MMAVTVLATLASTVRLRFPLFLIFSLSSFALPSPASDVRSTPFPNNKNIILNDFDTLSNNTDHLFVNASSPEPELLCADGKGPLLEGEERIFPCAGDCPGGFDCEFPFGREKGGICCPNLSELYRLYTERSGEEEEEGTEKEEKLRVEKKSNTLRKEGPKSVKPKDMGGVDAMALLEQHYGEGIARARPTSPHTVAKPSPEATDNLLVSSRAVEIRRSQPKHQKSQQDFVWRPRSAQHASKTFTAQSKRNMDTSGEEYSCRRQKLELFCEDRRRQTQFVLRWYAKDRVCVSYPWGYCSGKPVASDPTIRTREECELLCSDPLDFRNRNVRLGEERRVGGGGGERNAGGDGATPVDLSKPEETFETVPSAAADEKFTESVRGEGEAPFVAVAGAQNVEASAPETNPSASSAEFSEFLATEQRRQPKKRCLKVSPYRSMCPDGMPSQFTLRWHFRDDACFAYPYGYCHGESVMEEEPIKTEQECLKTCAVGEQSQHQMTPEDPILKKDQRLFGPSGQTSIVQRKTPKGRE